MFNYLLSIWPAGRITFWLLWRQGGFCRRAVSVCHICILCNRMSKRSQTLSQYGWPTILVYHRLGLPNLRAYVQSTLAIKLNSTLSTSKIDCRQLIRLSFELLFCLKITVTQFSGLIGSTGGITNDDIADDLWVTYFIKKWPHLENGTRQGQLQWMTNSMSYVLYRIVLLPMILSDFEGHFSSRCNVL